MSQLGKLVKIDNIRSIWKHEARDFSKWLSEEENLVQLSDAIGIEISLKERESSVGDFSVDLFATEEGSGRKIIIENQLEETDHDHLGKIITYAAGKSADVVIWIVKYARDEHRQAVEWLNQRTDENVGFFLIEVELWMIGDSLPAPNFNVIERPNSWAKAMKTIEDSSETKSLQYKFWQNFVDYAFAKPHFSSQFRSQKPRLQHYYDLRIGKKTCLLSLTVNTKKKRIGCCVYIRNDKYLFTKFAERKDAIKQFIGSDVEWIEADKDCRVVIYKQGDIKEEETWSDIFDWFCTNAIKLKEMVKNFDV